MEFSEYGLRPNLYFEQLGFTNPHPSGWYLSKERLKEKFEKGDFVIKKMESYTAEKNERDCRGKQSDNLRMDIPIPLGNECKGYPTQKPLALLCCSIEASTSKGDPVLDPLC